jgi:hypothetical protein
MVSYFKTQWLRIVFGVVGLVVAALCLFKPDGELAALLWFITGLLSFVMSYIDWHHERIELLEAKAKKYDALAEKVDALQELLETEGKYSNHLNKRIDSLVHVVEELRRGN